MKLFNRENNNPTKLIYSVYDSKIKAYGQIFLQMSEGEALRSFTDIVNDPQSIFNKHPEDYTLFEIGTWDYTEGKINCHNTPKSIIKASTVLKPLAQMNYPVNPRINTQPVQEVQQ